MEVLVVNAREHLTSLDPSTGCNLLHLAAAHNHSQVCSLLAAEVIIGASLSEPHIECTTVLYISYIIIYTYYGMALTCVPCLALPVHMHAMLSCTSACVILDAAN